MKSFRGNGKLLLTGEYVVLDGALALALPTKLGQRLDIEENDSGTIVWKSLGHLGDIWFEGTIESNSEGRPIFTGNPSETGSRLVSILEEAWKLNPELLSKSNGFEVTAHLEFPGDWGLGSSSTLIHCIASWFDINPYALLQKTFGGSGYDIAAAGMQGPFLFQRTCPKQAQGKTVSGRRSDSLPYQITPQDIKVRPVVFDPVFRNELFFVHLNRKQNSRHSIAQYRNQPQAHLETIIEQISSLTHKIVSCDEIEEFEALIASHETLLSKTIASPTIKSSIFPDYPREIKSLGGWGGDFILATGGEKERDYFRNKGFLTQMEYEKMIK